jgi:uncharacterized protein (TIGR03067 family)
MDRLKMKDPIMNDLDEIQGDWKQIGYERDGVKEPLDEKGWEPRVTFSGGSVPIKGTFKLDLTKQPKSMGLTDTFGADEGKTFLAIYSLEGDRLPRCRRTQTLAGLMLHRWSEGPGGVVPPPHRRTMLRCPKVLSLMPVGLFLRKRSTYKLAEPLN